jgi:hypothetical protein
VFGGAIGVTPDFQLSSSPIPDAGIGWRDAIGLVEGVTAGVAFPPPDNQRFI